MSFDAALDIVLVQVSEAFPGHLVTQLLLKVYPPPITASE